MKFLFVLLLIFFPNFAHAYQVSSAFGDPCHESISLDAYLNSAIDVSVPEDFELPKDETWKAISDSLIDIHNVAIADEVQRFIIVSLLLGIRSPDTEGHVLLDLHELRSIHLAEEGQYLHALRAVDDDGVEGDASAVKGIRAEIESSLQKAAISLGQAPIIDIETSVDYYGRVNLQVSGPAFYLGRAMHTLQDSFSHTIRSPNARKIYHIMNYVEAVSGELEEKKDGMAHSDSMDACDGETDPMFNAAKEATIHLITASTQGDVNLREEKIQEVLDTWLVYEKGCDHSNNYCDSKWVAVARKKPTGPYLETALGCSLNSKPTSLWIFIFVFGFCVFQTRTR